MKKLIGILLAIVLVLSLVACGSTEPTTKTDAPIETSEKEVSTEGTKTVEKETKRVGISMPTKSLQRWNQDGGYMEQMLKEAGYEVDLQYAGDNDIPTQVAQIENMITTGVDVLVITAIDASSLTEALKAAETDDIKVIAYDRLIMNTEALDYYVTFDNERVGSLQAEYIVEALDLDNNDGPFNIELVAGAPDDNTANFFWKGSMSVLDKYLEEGKLVVPSGQTKQQQAATPQYSMEEAQKRMENLVSSQSYGPDKTKLDAVLAVNDSTANGSTNALLAAGFTAENFPIITGQDCDITTVMNIMAGTQAMSVFKDTRTTAARVVTMIESIFAGQEVEVNDTTTYDNGLGLIPAFLAEPVVCTKDNIEEVLIDSGYYTKDQLGLD